eukprot:46440-Pyramimonas_sp.AAC.1
MIQDIKVRIPKSYQEVPHQPAIGPNEEPPSYEDLAERFQEFVEGCRHPNGVAHMVFGARRVTGLEILNE